MGAFFSQSRRDAELGGHTYKLLPLPTSLTFTWGPLVKGSDLALCQVEVSFKVVSIKLLGHARLAAAQAMLKGSFLSTQLDPITHTHTPTSTRTAYEFAFIPVSQLVFRLSLWHFLWLAVFVLHSFGSSWVGGCAT